MAMMSSAQGACISYFVVLECFIVPFMCVICYRYFIHRHLQIIYERHYQLVLGIQLCSILNISIQQPLQLSLYACDFSPSVSVSNPGSNLGSASVSVSAWILVLRVVSDTLWSLTSIGVLSIILVRTWIVSYDIKLARSTEKSKWKNIINSTQTNWTLSHLHTWGNLAWVSNRMAGVYAVCNAVFMLLEVLGSFALIPRPYEYMSIATMVQLYVITLPFIITIFVIRVTTPTYNDAFGIKKEISLVMYVCIIVVLWFSVTPVIFALTTNVSASTSQRNSVTMAFVNSVVLVITFMLLILIPSYFTLTQIKNYTKTQKPLQDISEHQQSQQSQNQQNHSQDKERDVHNNHNNNNNKDSDVEKENSVVSPKRNHSHSLFSINHKQHSNNYNEASSMTDSDRLFVNMMQNYEPFEAFVIHVQREFSLENIVGYVEFHQMAHYVFPSVPHEHESRHRFVLKHNLKLPSNIPVSSILHNDAFSFNKKVSLLHYKYVRNHAILELNLPSMLRKQWLRFVTKLVFKNAKERGKKGVRSDAHLWRAPSFLDLQKTMDSTTERKDMKDNNNNNNNSNHNEEEEKKSNNNNTNNSHSDTFVIELQDKPHHKSLGKEGGAKHDQNDKNNSMHGLDAEPSAVAFHKSETIQNITRIATKIMTGKSGKIVSVNLNFDEENVFLDAPHLEEPFAIELLGLIERVLDECSKLMKDSFMRYDEKDIMTIRKTQIEQLSSMSSVLTQTKNMKH